MEDKDVKKIDLIDDEAKSVLGEFLEVTKDMRSLILKEIKQQKEIAENFDRNKEEYIEAISELDLLEKSRMEEEKKKHLERIKELKEKLKSV